VSYLKNKLRRLVARVTAKHVYHSLPRGVELAYDIENSLPTFAADIVFDVGANVGQSAQSFLEWFPRSRIYCFEPVSATFRQLQNNLKDNDRAFCYCLALGSSASTGQMLLQGSPDMFSLSSRLDRVPNGNVPTEHVQVATLDDFCLTHSIDRINFLKIDTEGGDLDVLRGAEHMLNDQKIDLVQVEAGMNVNNKWHVPFELLKDYLESRSHFLFAIYEQVSEWPTSEPHLRRTNPVFISRRMIETNRHSLPLGA
jgi:FkbM family methyltransferase